MPFDIKEKKIPQKSSWFGIILQNIIESVNGRKRPEPIVLLFMCWENKAWRETARGVKEIWGILKKKYCVGYSWPISYFILIIQLQDGNTVALEMNLTMSKM